MFRKLACLALAAACACGPKAAPATLPTEAPIATPTPTPAPTPPPAPASTQPAFDLKAVWTLEQTQPILDKTQRSRLAPNLSHLTAGETAAVPKLIAAGAIMQELYEDQRHIDAPAARAYLASLDKSARSDQLRQLYRLFQGPIATTLDFKYLPFLGNRPFAASTTMYPWGIEKAEVEAFLKEHPDRRESILGPRTVVRRAEKTALDTDLATLARYPVLDTLHPGLRNDLEALRAQPAGLYAVPYSVAFADRLLRVHALLNEAATLVAKDDPELASYLRNRSRDLLSDDYESGDAAWIMGTFKNLNVQIGAYESNDDELFGVKTYFSFSLLARRLDDTAALHKGLVNFQAFEDALPTTQHRRVSDRVPISVYDVVVDFGQTRSGNTTNILPNEPMLLQRYGKTIQMRANIMHDAAWFDPASAIWRAVIAPTQATDLTSEAMLRRALWHEVGHFVGIDKTKDGRPLAEAFTHHEAELLEEMKGDMFALYSVRMLRQRGYYDDAQVRAMYAAGVQRLIRGSKPRREQTYHTMWLMELNFLISKRVVKFDAKTSQFSIDYARYHDAVRELLARVLELQRNGDKAAVEKFIDQYATWDDAVHGVIGKRAKETLRFRNTLYTYAALGE